MKKKISSVIAVLRVMGVTWLLLRVCYEVKKKWGLLQISMPLQSWDSVVLDQQFDRMHQQQWSSFFSAKQQAFIWDNDHYMVVEQAEEIMSNTFTLFSNQKINYQTPINWHQNPFNSDIQLPLRHWSLISESAYGDLKLVWELNRFSFAYVLARAYARTKDERYASKFWWLFEHWLDANPPNFGVNWKCGQEISVRVMACCFAVSVFYASTSTTQVRLTKFLKMLVASGERIDKNINYAVRQQNNHGVGEAVGLWTISQFLPAYQRSTDWKKRSLAILVSLSDELIYADGAYCQHSTNYMRVTLQYYLWMVAAARKLQQELPSSLEKNLHNAYQFLYQLHDPQSGRVPNYGPNDGALVLPLNNCGYLDFRPVLQAWHYYFYAKALFYHGPWNEDLLWLFNIDTMGDAAPLAMQDLHADVGGYYTLRASQSWAFMRCGHFKHRPGHADQLHVDLWWKGHNIAIDPGTYSYFAPLPYASGFANTKYHNTVVVDRMDQMTKVSTFLWAPWSSGVVTKHQKASHASCWEGWHTGYVRLKTPVIHKRAVVNIDSEHWVVLDYLSSTETHQYDLHFLLNDFPYTWCSDTMRMCLDVHGDHYMIHMGSSALVESMIARADEQSAMGWQSLYYQTKQQAISVTLSASTDNVLFWTVFGPDVVKSCLNNNALSVELEHISVFIILSDLSSTIVEEIKYNHAM